MEAYVRDSFSLDRVRAELADDANTFLLAFMDGAEQPRGYAKLRTGTTDPSVIGPNPVELQRLYVDTSAMGHGIGAALMRASLEAARSSGHRTLWLGVWERNARAISFYEQWKFKTVGDHVFRLGSDHQRDLIMARPVADIQGPQFAIRPAHRHECRRIAELYRISSAGVADYIWTKLARSGEDILDVGRRRYEREGTPFSYENCRLVELEGDVVGMLVAFPMEVDAEHEETDPILLPYSVLEEDRSFYICGMAVDEGQRGKGLGKMLLEEAERTCLHLGLAKLSLIVFEQNVRARRLYERCGYVETRRHPVVPHPLIHYTGDALLMVKNVGRT